MNKQKITTFNLKNEKEINEFSEVSTQELIDINSELLKYRVAPVQKQMLVKLFNYEKMHNKMMWFEDLRKSIRYGIKFSYLLLKRLIELRELGLIHSFFDENSVDASMEEECYMFNLTPKGKRFIDYMRSGR